MSDDYKIKISASVLENLYLEFVQFLKDVAQENFHSFKKSDYVDKEENYKYSIYDEAKRQLRSTEWSADSIGKGEIQKAVIAAMRVKPKHNHRSYDNNLINWRKIDSFASQNTDESLEQLFFDFYKNKNGLTPQKGFEKLMEKEFDYQTIAYLFFIKDRNQFLPISQEVFDKVIAKKLQIDDFQTSRRVSWGNYKTFLEIIKQTHRFLIQKNKDATLLDAHSFLWILGKQREDWLEKNPAQFDEADRVEETLEPLVVNQAAEIVEDTTDSVTKQFTPTDIVWIKNITNKERGRAYMDEEDVFTLHFPTNHKSNVLSPKIGEIILLTQRIDFGEAVFTHLVTPVDDILRDDNEREDYKYGRKVRIIAKTPLDKVIKVSSTEWRVVRFGGITQGNACKIENITDVNPIEVFQLDVWEKFAPFFVNDDKESVDLTSAFLIEIENENPELSVTEGKLKLVSHFRRERNSEIVRIKKQQAMDNENLRCEVCKFSFQDKYAVDFIECHHKTPISQTGVTKTTLDDLALVCANCHRMLHKRFEGEFLTIEQLKNRIANS